MKITPRLEPEEAKVGSVWTLSPAAAEATPMFCVRLDSCQLSVTLSSFDEASSSLKVPLTTVVKDVLDTNEGDLEASCGVTPYREKDAFPL